MLLTRPARTFCGMTLTELYGEEIARRFPMPGRLSFKSLIVATLLAVFFAIVIKSLFFESFKIPTDSMTPTIQPGDHVIVSKLTYGMTLPLFGEVRAGERPKVGDIVVFRHDEKNGSRVESNNYVKRIAALPGDKVEVIDRRVYVNGKRLTIFKSLEGRGVAEQIFSGPVVLGEDEFFVLGDNSQNSFDSRYFGTVKRHEIVGKVLFVYWSWELVGNEIDIAWSRIGTSF